MFYVDFANNQYYDDFQLDELDKWCTDYLKENVDENIISVKINFSYIYDISNDISNVSNEKWTKVMPRII